MVVANSIDGVTECIKYFGARPEGTVRVYNLLERDALEQRASEPVHEFAARKAEFSICVMGRLDPMKGIDTVIVATSRLPSELDWRLWVIGDGPARIKLEHLAKELNVADRIHFLGWLDNPHRILAKASVYVLASSYEGFSNSAIEAMALGVPVLTSNCSSDAAEMVARGAAAGFRFDDVDGLCCELLNLRRSPDSGTELTRKAKDYIIDLDAELAVRGYEAVISRAIGMRRPVR